jgi:hypothetical protein
MCRPMKAGGLSMLHAAPIGPIVPEAEKYPKYSYRSVTRAQIRAGLVESAPAEHEVLRLPVWSEEAPLLVRVGKVGSNSQDAPVGKTQHDLTGHGFLDPLNSQGAVPGDELTDVRHGRASGE